MFEFAWPWVFVFLPLPLLFHWLIPANKRQKSAVYVPFYQQLSQGGSVSTKKSGSQKRWLFLLMLLIWILIVAAAARPQWVGNAIALDMEGRDLLVAVDISESMQQQDMLRNNSAISRIDAVKDVVSDFIERRRGDRIGLVLFGTNAYLQAPLTFDTETVATFLQEAQLGFAGPQTAIGDAIGLSVKRLEELPDAEINDQVIILLTDGANTAGEVDPLQAAALAKQTDIKIYTIGIGADEMIVNGFFGPRRINPSAQLDERTLTSIAQTTGGRYFRARQTQELDAIYAELDNLEPIDHDQEWFRPTQVLFYWLLLVALGLMIVSYLISLLLGLSKRSTSESHHQIARKENAWTA